MVLDTNVVVSAALLPSSLPGQALELVICRGTLLVSAPTALELGTVLLRPRLNCYLHAEEASDLLASALRFSEPIEVAD